jgi:hypothetical protein
VSNPFDWTGGASAMSEMWRSWTTMAPPDTTALFGGAQVGDLLRNMTEGPRLADAGTAEHRMAKLTERWIEFQTASRAYEGVVASAWMTANQRYAAARPETLEPEAALKLWLDTANTTLLETQRSPSFLAAQRQALRRGMEFLLAQREVVESVAEPAGLPTRSEIDEVHRSIHDLKRRLRTLERR